MGEHDLVATGFGYNDQREVLAQAFVDATEARHRRESWNSGDLYAASLQASLLSYRSATDFRRLYGNSYVDSAPETYAHNCPWNDWTPPSQSLQLFNAAASNKKSEVIFQRVRVLLCKDARPEGPTLIAFASVESDSKAAKFLLFRRGAEVLASIPLSGLEAKVIDHQRHVLLSPNMAGKCQRKEAPCLLSTPPVCLKFEDDRRLAKFCDML